MDRNNTALDDPNIKAATLGPGVPTFALYGEDEGTVLGHWLHCESIPARSSRNAWEILPHRHRSYFQVLYQSAGSGECLTADACSPLRPPVVVTIPPGAVHGFRFSDDVEGWVLTVAGERVLSVVEAAPEVGGLLVRPQVIELAGREAEPAIGSAFSMISSELMGLRPARGVLMDAQLRSIVILLARLAESRDGSPASAALRHAVQFREQLDSSYREEHSAGFYAHRLGISHTHLNRVCHAAFGKTALEVIHDRLVLEASRDLALTAMTVQDISRSLGFDDGAYFSRLFKKVAGTSPMSFRRQAAARQRAWPGSADAEWPHPDAGETALSATSTDA
jgi:AraC family transcriptional activator of pobA